MEVFWSVSFGVNKTHLWEAKIFNRLKDAKSFASTLQFYKIYRHTSEHPFSTKGTDKLIERKNI